MSSGGKAGVIPVPLSLVESISALRVYLSGDLSSLQIQAEVLKSVYKAVSSFKDDGVPLLDAVGDMGSENEEVVQGRIRLRDIKTRMEASDLAGDYRDVLAFETRLEARREELEGKEERGLVNGMERAEVELGERAKAIYVCRRRILLEREQLELEGKMKISQLHLFKDELRGRMKVLRRMQYVNDDGVVTLKGRCACEIEIAQDLVAVEMMLSGAFNNAPPGDQIRRNWLLHVYHTILISDPAMFSPPPCCHVLPPPDPAMFSPPPLGHELTLNRQPAVFLDDCY